jgi:hypothetical protein
MKIMCLLQELYKILKIEYNSMIPDKKEADRIAERIIFIIFTIPTLELYHITVEEFEELHNKVFFPKRKIFTTLFGCYFVREKPEIEKGVNSSMIDNCQLQLMKNQRVIGQAVGILEQHRTEIANNKWELKKLTEKIDKSVERQEELFGKLVMSNTNQVNTSNLNLEDQ